MFLININEIYAEWYLHVVTSLVSYELLNEASKNKCLTYKLYAELQKNKLSFCVISAYPKKITHVIIYRAQGIQLYFVDVTCSSINLKLGYRCEY